MAFKDYYQILGVDRKATSKEIKAAYRALARTSHPDLHPGDQQAEKTFSEINEAYEVLQDREKRQQFDEIADYVQAHGQPPPGQTDEETEEGAASFFEQFFGRRYSRASPRPGADIHAEIEISLQEAVSGTTRRFNLNRREMCSSCQGSGVVGQSVCPACRGGGEVAAPQSLEAKIPAGVTQGSVIRLAGQGQPGHQGAARGDLLFTISLLPDPQYRVNGYDLYRDLEVSVFTAILGGEVQVVGPKGKLALKVPAETQNGKVFRLRGQGLSRADGKPAGDLYATVSLRIPSGLSEEVRQQFGQLRDQVEKG